MSSVFFQTTRADLERSKLEAPAAYFTLGGEHKLALCQLRSQSTLLAADMTGEEEEPDAHCVACHTHLCTLKDRLHQLQSRSTPVAAHQVQSAQVEIERMSAP